MLTQHNSTTPEFHILKRKAGKNGECLHNMILHHMDSYFEQEGWQKWRMFTKHISIPHRFYILSKKDGKNGKCLHNIFLLHMNLIF